MTLEFTPPLRLAERAKWSFNTRRVARRDAVRLLDDASAAQAGDLVLGRVEKLGQHRNIQLPEGRAAELFPGDLVVVPCGARYAADQFEGVAEIDPEGADLLAGGGLLGRMRAKHGRMSAPTRVQPIGLLADRAGRAINLADYALAPAPAPLGLAAIGVVGASMNAGKTATTASLAHGLARAGRRVAAIKATGTGAFGDMNAYADAGAHERLDMTDAGMASTYLAPFGRVRAGLFTLLAEAARRGCDAAVVEFADGVFQKETAALLADAETRACFGGWLYAAGDSLAAFGGVAALAPRGVRPLALSGLVARSPLLAREAEAATGLRVLDLADLRDPAEAATLLHGAEAALRSAA